MARRSPQTAPPQSRNGSLPGSTNNADSLFDELDLNYVEGYEVHSRDCSDLEDVVGMRARAREEPNRMRSVQDRDSADDLDTSSGFSNWHIPTRRNGQEIDRATMVQSSFSETIDPLRLFISSSTRSYGYIGPAHIQGASSQDTSTELTASSTTHRKNSPIASSMEAASQSQPWGLHSHDPHAFKSSRRLLPSRLRDFINFGRQHHNSAEQILRTAAPPLQSPSRFATPPQATLNIIDSEPSGRYQGSPSSQRRRPRFSTNNDMNNPEQPHTGDHNHIGGSRWVDHLNEMRHRKRRRANSPAQQSAPPSAQEASQTRVQSQVTMSGSGTSFLSSSTQGSDSFMSRLSRSISSGGGPKSHIAATNPPLNIPLTSAMPHFDCIEMLRQAHSPLTSGRSDVPFTPTTQSSSDFIPQGVRLGSRNFIFFSEIYPRRFTSGQRLMLNRIFRASSARIPAAVGTSHGPRKGINYHLYQPKPQLKSRRKDLPLGPGRRGWPAGCLPVEVFDIIVGYLPRGSIAAMRLVNGEFEMKTSNRLFHTVVVPFRSEIYGMMTHKSETESISPMLQQLTSRAKGKGKAKVQFDEADEDKVVHDGMKVFEAWGPHIKKFAMTFEVNESSLETAPIKGKFEHHTTWWGGYDWPHPHYNRYEYCEGLEKKADEFKCMSQAMSYLKGTTELGLSLDSGLGWLIGPDISDRAKLYQDKPEVFGRRHSQPDLEMLERMEIWNELSQSAMSTRTKPPGCQSQDGFYEAQVMLRGGSARITIPGVNNQPSHYPLIFEGVDLATKPNSVDPNDAARYAIEGLAALAKSNGGHFSNAPLKPKDLTTAQQEWLLETEWAQRAFLSSFCMALADNSHTFRHVHTLNISKLSSRYLSALERDDIWSALPSMNSLTINVSADWRNIIKSDTGIVESPSILPSKAATKFYALLKNHVAYLSNVKHLSVGYISGGEHQVGIFGRNRGILPPPLMNFADPQAIFQPLIDVLALPHVENLTLSNCWLTPDLLKTFISQMSSLSLCHLSLNSVSLTSNTAPTSQTESIEISPNDGTYDRPQGPPRRNCPSVGNFFSLHHWSTPDPEPLGWTTQGVRIGSWANVIDAITPGPTMDFTRYAFRYHDKPPPPRETNLERVSLTSCGYVCLTHFKDFHQREVGEVVDQLPHYLIKRAVDLLPVMMTCSNDALVGQIVPSLKDEETEALENAFGMAVGWGGGGLEAEDWEINPRGRDGEGDPERAKQKWENLEDGQPVGGSGRFGGMIERLVLVNLEEGE